MNEMSVHITLNGKFSKYCGKSALIDENARKQKEEFEKRRLERLQQVREESKNLARNIREQVKSEKQRQLRRLESIKLQEQNLWKERVLAHKNHGYSSALFQIGTAHRAAQIENNIMSKKFSSDASYKDFQKKRTERLCNQASYMPANICNCCCSRNAGTQTSVCRNRDINIIRRKKGEFASKVSTPSSSPRVSRQKHNNTPVTDEGAVETTEPNTQSTDEQAKELHEEEMLMHLEEDEAIMKEWREQGQTKIKPNTREQCKAAGTDICKKLSFSKKSKCYCYNYEEEEGEEEDVDDDSFIEIDDSNGEQNNTKNVITKKIDGKNNVYNNTKNVISKKLDGKNNVYNDKVNQNDDNDDVNQDDDNDDVNQDDDDNDDVNQDDDKDDVNQDDDNDDEEYKHKDDGVDRSYNSDSDISGNLEYNSSNSASSLPSSEHAVPIKIKENGNQAYLCRTPAVLLDVEVGSHDCVSINMPCEIKDNHIANNRQFSHVIRISPKKSKKTCNCICGGAKEDIEREKITAPNFEPDQHKKSSSLLSVQSADKKTTSTSEQTRMQRSTIAQDPKEQSSKFQKTVAERRATGHPRGTSTQSTREQPKIQKSSTLSKGTSLSIEKAKTQQTKAQKPSVLEQSKAKKPSTFSTVQSKKATQQLADASKATRSSSSSDKVSKQKILPKNAAPLRSLSDDISNTSSILEQTELITNIASNEKISGSFDDFEEQEGPGPRFTAITELIEKQKKTQTSVEVVRSTSEEKRTSDLQKLKPTTGTAEQQRSSEQRNLPHVSNQSIISGKAIRLSCRGSQSCDSFIINNINSNERIKHFDYNNKYSREYSQTMTTVRSHQRDELEPTAMDNANFEKVRQIERDAQIELLRQRSNERGQKAIEREQVRCDCDKLTEKLDALARQNPQLLPSDAPLLPGHYFADKAARKESKMNTAVEEILLRPAIITCPDVETQPRSSTAQERQRPATETRAGEVNIGARQQNETADRAVEDDNMASRCLSTTDSCHSLLLGYVNDQGKQIKRDLKEFQARSSKEDLDTAKRLKKLLDRVDRIRNCLLEELKSKTKLREEGSNSNNVENDIEQVIDSISDLRKERENILIDEITKGRKVASNDYANELRLKETLIEQKIREFCQMQKACEENDKKQMQEKPMKKTRDNEKSANVAGAVKVVKPSKERYVLKDGSKPLEIIIRVQNEICKPIYKQKMKKGITKSTTPKKKIPNKATTATVSKPSDKTAEKPIDSEQVTSLNRQDSYDSNSTSYRSLPPVLNQNLAYINQKTAATDEWAAQLGQSKKTVIHPMIAQYVQRLLTMTRSSVKALSVSSSEIETPTSSVIQTPGNMSASASSDDLLASGERLTQVQNFIEENRSFINELEETIRSQSNMSLETSMRAFEEIWQQRLQRLQTTSTKRPSKSIIKEPKKQDSKTFKRVQIDNKGSDERPPLRENSSSLQRLKVPPIVASTPAQKSELLSKHAKENRQMTTIKSDQSKTIRKSPEQRLKKVDKSSNTELKQAVAEAEIIRFNELTDSCTTRINELNDLINKVREEKQRLMEITLSSVSDIQQSTEYFDLPNTKQQDDKTTSEDSRSKLHTNLMADQAISMENVVPLEKNKPTGISNDSGIAMSSRPVTALEQHIDTDPLSIESTTSATTSSQRRTASHPPPPTLRRFSPQLLEDEPVHELSTIMEVDTPVTSRLNATTEPPTIQKTSTEESSDSFQPPIVFPTFEEYVKEMNFDLTQIDAEQTLLFHQEFDQLIAALKQAHDNNALSPQDFPTFNAFLANFSDRDSNEDPTLHEHTPETIDELLAQMRIANLSVKKFPTQREHAEHLKTNTPEQDSESYGLTNTERQLLTSTDSESLNIEEELRKRNLLRGPLGANSTTHNNHKAKKDDDDKDKDRDKNKDKKSDANVFCSTLHGDKQNCKLFSQMFPGESGIEKLSTSTENLSGDVERELAKLGLQWPTIMRLKNKETMALSSSSTTTSLSREEKKIQKTIKLQSNRGQQPDESKETKQTYETSEDHGRPLNLRDFLTRELLKHCNVSSNSSSPDDSLRSQFLHSVIGTMTPNCGTGGTTTLDRQKTSTPVISQNSSPRDGNTGSSTSAGGQLFSGESRISSVHYQEELTVDFETSKQKKIGKSPTKKSPKK